MNISRVDGNIFMGRGDQEVALRRRVKTAHQTHDGQEKFRIRVGSGGVSRLSRHDGEGSSEKSRNPNDKSYPTLLAFFISLAAISKSQANPHAHESEGREQEDKHSSTDRPLAILGGPRRVGVAHGAALREGWSAPQNK